MTLRSNPYFTKQWSINPLILFSQGFDSHDFNAFALYGAVYNIKEVKQLRETFLFRLNSEARYLGSDHFHKLLKFRVAQLPGK